MAAAQSNSAPSAILISAPQHEHFGRSIFAITMCSAIAGFRIELLTLDGRKSMPLTFGEI
ncbi:MAG: hypothetical protein DMF56_21690 [Acidobacteria bacterium]|nr:MAG: hypothetical protein DMF56_21690 [Acidobacteriota bacterium]